MSRSIRGGLPAAKKELHKLVAEVNAKYVISPSVKKMTFSQLFERWIVGLSLTTDEERSRSTQYQERQRFERHVEPTFGNVVIEKVSPGEIRAFYIKLRKPHVVKGGSIGPALSTTSVARIHETLRAMCSWGQQMEIIAVNPISQVKRPKISHPAPKAPEVAAVMKLLKYLRTNDLQLWCAVRLASTTGMRRSELAALRFSDIRWRKPQSVNVERGMLAVPFEGRVKTETKTGAIGAAKLPIDEDLAHSLYLLRVQYGDQELKRRNRKDVASDYIFAEDPFSQKGWHPDTFTNRLRAAVQEVSKYDRSVRQVTFKSLRAFTASELAASGTDVTTAQFVLRHKSVVTTLRHYSAARERNVRGATLDLGNRLAQMESE